VTVIPGRMAVMMDLRNGTLVSVLKTGIFSRRPTSSKDWTAPTGTMKKRVMTVKMPQTTPYRTVRSQLRHLESKSPPT
jgi:hypothetical protein